MSSPLDYLFGLPSISPITATFDPVLARWPTLNVLLPGVDVRAMSGGPNTVVQISHRLAGRGVPVRYISTDIPAARDHTAFWDHASNLTGVPHSAIRAEIKCASDRSRAISLGENDMFMASAWWNVQMIKRLMPHTRPRQFFYLIQEFEPGLYPLSTEHALSLETYDLDYFGLINERLILDYMVRNEIGRFAEPDFVTKRCVPFEPAIDRRVFTKSPTSTKTGRRLIFYARPNSAKRNLFELGLYALKTAAETGVFDGDDWEMFFVGEALPDARLTNTITIRSMPWLSMADYGAFVADSDIALSLMLSPHTSYLPLETAAAGGVCVTSVYANKTTARLAELSPRILGVKPSLEGVVSGLRDAVDRVSRGIPAQGAQIDLPASWNDALEPVVTRAANWFRQNALAQQIPGENQGA